jgi:hypothetical protein
LPWGHRFSVDGGFIPVALQDYRVVADIAERDAIPAGDRYVGLTVNVVDERQLYSLIGGIADVDWQPWFIVNNNGGLSIQALSGEQPLIEIRSFDQNGSIGFYATMTGSNAYVSLDATAAGGTLTIVDENGNASTLQTSGAATELNAAGKPFNIVNTTDVSIQATAGALALTASGNVTVNGALEASATQLNVVDAVIISFGTSTGTRIGSDPSEKFAFWNADPVVQPAAVADAAGGATVDTEARASLNALLARVRTLGLIDT